MNGKSIPGYLAYKITPEGIITKNDRPIKISTYNHETPTVRLRQDGISKTFLVAKLVALTFLEDTRKSDSDVVAYRDGNNHNFSLSNVYWTTRADAYSKLYDKESRYSEIRVQKLRDKICKPVVAMKSLNGVLSPIKEFKSIKDASTFAGVSSGSIIRCLKNPGSMSAGYYWRYLEREED